jgi:hypothetical protein
MARCRRAWTPLRDRMVLFAVKLRMKLLLPKSPPEERLATGNYASPTR